MKGIITKVVENGRFFFVDNIYWCHFDKINFNPSVFEEVEYTRNKDRNGKDIALNVLLIVSSKNTTSPNGTSFFSTYIDELKEGYFTSSNHIKKKFILDYPKELATLFSKDSSINKTTQIRKYFDFCRKIESIYNVKKDFSYVKAELPRLIYFINYALNKKPPLVSKEFKEFVEKNIELASLNEDNFTKGFLYHFEAVIGFSNNN